MIQRCSFYLEQSLHWARFAAEGCYKRWPCKLCWQRMTAPGWKAPLKERNKHTHHKQHKRKRTNGSQQMIISGKHLSVLKEKKHTHLPERKVKTLLCQHDADKNQRQKRRKGIETNADMSSALIMSRSKLSAH